MLLVVDVQERLLPHICDANAMQCAITRLVRAAGVLGVPLLASEQNPRGLGGTAGAIRDAWPGEFAPMNKETFSCCGDAAMTARLRAEGRQQLIVVGIEAHVCVQQTVLQLRELDYQVFVAADAIGSRRARDRDIAIARMSAAGATVSTAESLIMELQQRYTNSTFRAILEIIR